MAAPRKRKFERVSPERELTIPQQLIDQLRGLNEGDLLDTSSLSQFLRSSDHEESLVRRAVYVGKDFAGLWKVMLHEASQRARYCEVHRVEPSSHSPSYPASRSSSSAASGSSLPSESLSISSKPASSASPACLPRSLSKKRHTELSQKQQNGDFHTHMPVSSSSSSAASGSNSPPSSQSSTPLSLSSKPASSLFFASISRKQQHTKQSPHKQRKGDIHIPVLKGSPGVGKSVLCFLLAIFMCIEYDILYLRKRAPGMLPAVFLFSKGKIAHMGTCDAILSRESLIRVFASGVMRPAHVLIFLDGYPPDSCNMPDYDLWCTSGGMSLTSEMASNHRLFCMPVWGFEDMCTCFEHMRDSLDMDTFFPPNTSYETAEDREAALRAKYAFSGGSIQEFLWLYEDMIQHLDSTLNLVAASDLKSALREAGSCSRGDVHRIVRLFTIDQSYRRVRAVIDSQYYLKKLTNKLTSADYNCFFNYVKQQGGALYGNVFEPWLHKCVEEKKRIVFYFKKYKDRDDGKAFDRMEVEFTKVSLIEGNEQDVHEYLVNKIVALEYWHTELVNLDTACCGWVKEEDDAKEDVIEEDEAKDYLNKEVNEELKAGPSNGPSYIHVTVDTKHSLKWNRLLELDSEIRQRLRPTSQTSNYFLLLDSKEKVPSFQITPEIGQKPDHLMCSSAIMRMSNRTGRAVCLGSLTVLTTACSVGVDNTSIMRTVVTVLASAPIISGT